MPHLTLEYDTAAERAGNLSEVTRALFNVLYGHDAVPNKAAIKVRALPCPHALTGADRQGMVHATLWLLPGRDEATKSDLCQQLVDEMARRLPEVGSVSADVQDLSTAYAKRVL